MKKKNNLLLALLLSTTLIFAQFKSLERIIPSNAEMVVSINGNQITELLSITNFDQSEIGQLLLKEMKRSSDHVKSIADLGFKIDAKAYYFFEVKENTSFHNFLIKIDNRENFEKLFSSRDRKKIEIINNTRILDLRGDISVWTDNSLLLSFSKSLHSTDDENSKTSRKDYALNLLKTSAINSVLTIPSYTKSKNKKASASFWVKNYSDFMSLMLKDVFKSMGKLRGYQNMDFYGINALSGHLFFDKDKVALKTTMHIDKEWQNDFKKIYDKKFNKKFYKYFNQNAAIAYFNLTMSTKGILESYPNIMANMYETILPKYKEETRVAADLLNIILDEEAIEELIGGDFLFVLNDLKQQETNYTSYDYDADYKKTEVIKTKQELLPDFTLMMSSKNEKFLTRIMRLGIKHDLLGNKGSYYSIIEAKKLPIDLFIGIKNNIVFLTSSENRLQQIMLGTFKSNLGKHKKLLSKNAMTFYVNGTEIIKKTPKDMINFDKKFEKLMKIVVNKKLEVALSTSKFKASKIETKLIINTPENEENSLRFFFDLFNEFVSNK
ncbi:MAG: hypothetical protein COB98_10460 [Flavobacteriaceae bacterium]|nr:MAG: hypothetical protein COB98_10460 [Flavobacteriaceae bacterium]